MRFSPTSFVLGIAAASLVPMLSRVFRPFAVEATAAGMRMFDDARRVVAERAETLEDIVAEARVRREQLDAEALAASLHEQPESGAEPAASSRVRRRTNGAARRRAS